MSVLIRALRGLAATVALVLLLAVPPWLLGALIGNPWPDEGVSLMAPLTDDAFIGLIAAVAWLAWAQLAVVIVIEAVRAARGIGLPERAGVIGGQQRLVRSLIAAIAASIVISGTASAHATSSPQTGHSQAATQTSTAAATPDAGYKSAEHTTITVRAGDTLWGLAITHLGDGQRWHEIAHLNAGRTMPDGHRFGPNHLRPGWQLRIPAQADSAIRPVANPAEAGPQVRVRGGDTLSSIAATHLGDPNRWPELMRLNRGNTQAAGGRLSDPDQLRPGWMLRLPDNGHRPNDRDTAGDVGHRRDNRLEPMDKHSHAEVRLAPAASDTKSDNSTGGSPRRHSDRQGSDLDAQQQPPVQSSRHDASDDASAEATTSQGADETVFDAPWILAGLTGAGVLLAGSLFIGLGQRRRAQFRNRKPGRGIGGPDADLAPTEMTIAAAGSASAVIVEHMEAVLRRLAAAAHASHGQQMPPLASVELSAQRVTLHLSEPRALADPWQGTPDHTDWHVDVEVDLDDIGPTPDHSEPPYPQLVTIGEGDDGTLWLLNCEELGTVTVTGDPVRGRDFARHLTTQLAVNPWSATVQVDCVGLAAETDGLNDRVRYHEYDMADSAASNALADAVAMVDRTGGHDTDVSTGRAGGIGDEAWPSRILVWDGDVPHGRDLTSLAGLVQTQRGRAATTILFTGTSGGVDGFEVRVTADGRVVLEHAGLDLAAVGLTEDEARGCALLYAQSERVDEVAVPVPGAATEGWETYSDLAGGLRPEHTVARHSPSDAAGDATDEARASSLLAADDDAYVRAGAILPEDLQALAPRVPADVLAQVEDEDPCLDDDVADWADPDCDRPRLSLLGPVGARTHGKALMKRKPYFTELLAFLALHRRHGVTSDELCEAFGVTPETAHNYIKTTRSWVGTNPRTGQWHLPHADKSPAAHVRGVNVYQVDDSLLIDADLFKRLRLRGQARGGEEGSRDLIWALDLVRGRPFDQLRPGGWTWLISGERHDQYMTVAVTDVAVTIATDCLERGDLPRARTAAELAVLAAPAEEHTRLCLARVNEAAGDHAEADRIVRAEVCNRSDDGGAPTELSDRTKAIIRERQWLAS